MTYKKCVSS